MNSFYNYEKIQSIIIHILNFSVRDHKYQKITQKERKIYSKLVS